MDVKKFFDLMADVVAKSIAPFAKRVEALEKLAPQRGEKGEPGTNGVDGEKGEAGERGEPGTAGKDGVDGINGKDGKDGRDGEPGSRGDDGVAGEDGSAGRDGVDGKDGQPGRAGVDGKNGLHGERGSDGKDGADGTPGAAGRDGIDGKDGRNGVDGKSLTVDDVTSWLEGNFAKWALAAERRVYELGEKAVAAMPRPKDGVDGLRVEDFELVGRMLTLKRDGKILKQVRLGFPVYKGVFREGDAYEADDMVTFGGSVWHALDQTKSKPGTDHTWKLAVKKGKDLREARSTA